ncbi:hypothetical protein FRC06_005120, partial [Ceratobasidium sp. 370]
ANYQAQNPSASRSEGRLPVLLFTSSPIEQQLKEILSRPGIQGAIRAHRAHLRREGKDPGTYEDIQDAEMMKNLKKDGVNFFDNPVERDHALPIFQCMYPHFR